MLALLPLFCLLRGRIARDKIFSNRATLGKEGATWITSYRFIYSGGAEVLTTFCAVNPFTVLDISWSYVMNYDFCMLSVLSALPERSAAN